MRTMVLLHGISDEQMAQLQASVPDWKVVSRQDAEQHPNCLSEAEIVAGWNAAATEVCLQPNSKLRWVQSWGAGVDWMPLQALRDSGIQLTNASGVHAFPISETVFAMMLSLTRKIHISIRNQMNHHWHNPGSLGEIHGKTMGIIGVGSIGQEIARLAKAFHMRVLGVRRSGVSAPYVDQMYDLSGMHQVLAESDYVILALPLTDQTHHMFGTIEFQCMKSTAYFVNIGRGGTVDTEALLQALTSGEIAGAGLDVFEQEPLPQEHPLWSMEQVIVTPHNSGLTKAYGERVFEIFVHNLQDYLQGRPLSLNRIDFAQQY